MILAKVFNPDWGWLRKEWGAVADMSYPTPEVRVAAESSYPMPEVRGSDWEELPHIQGEATARAQEGRESYSTFKVRRGGREEIPLFQGKEQQLHFAGAAVKRYPTSKVRETQVRW